MAASRRIRDVTRVLTEEQYADYEPLLANSRRLRELVAELHELTLGIVEQDSLERGRPGRQPVRQQVD